jgi:hypothetical protein
MKKLIYNTYLGELWLWMIFIEWIYLSIKNINYSFYSQYTFKQLELFINNIWDVIFEFIFFIIFF